MASGQPLNEAARLHILDHCAGSMPEDHAGSGAAIHHVKPKAADHQQFVEPPMPSLVSISQDLTVPRHTPQCSSSSRSPWDVARLS